MMDRDKAIVRFIMVQRGDAVDLEIPLGLTANELVTVLNKAYRLGIDTSDVKSCYFKAENPIALLRANKTLSEFGIRNGSRIYYTE